MYPVLPNQHRLTIPYLENNCLGRVVLCCFVFLLCSVSLPFFLSISWMISHVTTWSLYMHYEFMTYVFAGVPRYGYPPVHPYYGPPGTVPNPYVYPGPLPTTSHSPMQDPSAKSNVATVTSGDSTLTPQPTHCELTIAF